MNLETPRTHAEYMARHRADYPECDCPNCTDYRDADECQQTVIDNARRIVSLDFNAGEEH